MGVNAMAVDREVARLLKDLARVGKRYTAAREKEEALREQARPLVISLALAGTPQHQIASALGVVREAIRRMEIKGGVDRGDPRIVPGSRGEDARRTEGGTSTQADEKRWLKELGQIGRKYKKAREDSKVVRDQIEPIVAELGRLRVPQKAIADASGVVRETIRRIEIKYGVDRGDPRAKKKSAFRAA